MTTSGRQTRGGRRNRSWLRRSHRWLGATVAVFVLVLATTGIALNHSDDWRLGERYVSWSWLLDAYGIHAPQPSAGFSDRGRYATLVGQRLYLDEREIAQHADALTGLATLDTLVLVATLHEVYVFTADGSLVEKIDLAATLAVPVERIGRSAGHAVIEAGGMRFRSDTEATAFEKFPGMPDDDVSWSRAVPAPASLMRAIDAAYRGRGLTVERVLLDVHSGRIVTAGGPLLMDIVALLLIVLSVTGLVLWLRNGRKGV
jgi:PepSY-associated TM region